MQNYRFGMRTDVERDAVARTLLWTNDVASGRTASTVVKRSMQDLHAVTQPPVGVSRSRALAAQGIIPSAGTLASTCVRVCVCVCVCVGGQCTNL